MLYRNVTSLGIPCLCEFIKYLLFLNHVNFNFVYFHGVQFSNHPVLQIEYIEDLSFSVELKHNCLSNFIFK